ncbi:MAG: DUF4080 domain-containing protein [Ruminococcaceae bacterium]|nr:DUF4080 domain-containing protein [Oscillospiraceae bacterium]
MKIVLFALNGSFSHSNLAIRCLRAPLERAGHEVVLLEHTLRDRSAHVLEHLYRERADVYGFSCYIWNLGEMLELSQALRRILPASRIVLGGPEVSYDTERFSGMDWIDTVVCCEGEEVFSEICRRFACGETVERTVKGKEAPLSGTGILYRDGEETGGIAYYESSRGCPYACAYCLSSCETGVRFKSTEETLRDLEAFEELRSDVRIIKFVDRTFNADRARANEIWRALQDPRFTKTYHFEICANLLDEESFEILSRFEKGKIQLELGLQSTNAETLSAVSRHADPARIIQAARRIRDMGNIHVHLDLIAGLPYEDYASFARSFDAAYGASDMLQVGFLKLLHGTALSKDKEAYGYRALPSPPYTVLENRWISYDELTRLSHVAEVLERYLESGRFAHALWYLTPYMSSPFGFWEGLTLYLAAHDARPLQRISQPDVFRYFLGYAKEALPMADETELLRLLRADFSAHEHKNPPAFLREA